MNQTLQNDHTTEILREARSRLSIPNPKFDQYFCSEKTVFDRVRLFTDLINEESTRFLFIGDDDFVSLMVATSLHPREVTVLDADPQVRSIIKETALQYNLPVHVRCYDVRDPLPRKFLNGYDIVFTDPPYTLAGIKVFLTRARLAMASDTSICAFCYSDLDIDPEPVESLLSSLSFRIQKQYPQFCYYLPAPRVVPAEYGFNCDNTEPWFYSDLLVLSPVSPNHTKNIPYPDAPLYEYT